MNYRPVMAVGEPIDRWIDTSWHIAMDLPAPLFRYAFPQWYAVGNGATTLVARVWPNRDHVPASD